MNKFLAIGHRGAKGYIMENTIASIAYAIELGVDAVEIDVYRCKSGELVVFHDETLERLSTRINKVEDLSLAELQLVLLYGGYSIPTLTEVIEFVHNRVVLNIELKGTNTALEAFKCVETSIKKSFVTKENFIISSFHELELRAYRELDPEIKIGVLTRGNIDQDIALSLELKAFSIHPFYQLVDASLIERLHQINLKVFPFTVNEVDEIESCIRYKVDGLFCDFPDRLVKMKSYFI